jgi:CubicO group peptidase (beta-lactamase class C family)
MKTRTLRLASALALIAPLASAFAADSLPERIARVENGLLPSTVIKGRAPPPASIAQRMAALHVPGASVAVINNGAIEWARGYGVAEAGGKRAVGTATLFQAASISKPVTAFGALHLVEQGKLALDEDVNQKLTTWKVPAGAQTVEAPVTMRNLLNHSAGTTVHGFRGYAAGEPVPTLLEVLDGAKPANSEAVRVAARPGAQWAYSGGGFSIAQLVMTGVSGNSFTRLMADVVLKPLGMKHSTYAQPLPPALHGAAASGHDESGKPIKGKWHTYPEQAAAGLWTTPSDLARFAIELQQASAGKSHKVISQAMAAQMLTRLKGSYGLGIALGEMAGVPSFSHGGSNEGFRTLLHAITEGGQGAVVMTNGDAGSALAGDIMRSIAAEYNWKEWRVLEKQVAQLGAQTLAQYAGSFQLGDMTIAVTRKGERLFIAAPPLGPEPRELFPSSQTDFFNLNDGMEFGFEANQAGKFDLIIKMDQPRKATRIP